MSKPVKQPDIWVVRTKSGKICGVGLSEEESKLSAYRGRNRGEFYIEWWEKSIKKNGYTLGKLEDVK